MRVSALLEGSAPRATILVRLLVGWVFLSEGVQKFLFPSALGVGRFTKIGIPRRSSLRRLWAWWRLCAAHSLSPACSPAWPLSLFLLIDITVAILTTKLPMLAKAGFWATMHEARTDICMWLGALFLILVGAGPWSVDARLRRSPQDPEHVRGLTVGKNLEGNKWSERSIPTENYAEPK